MDRRRYIPSSEGLEGRALLTSLFGSSTEHGLFALPGKQNEVAVWITHDEGLRTPGLAPERLNKVDACRLIFEKERLRVIERNRRGKQLLRVASDGVDDRIGDAAKVQSRAITEHLPVEWRLAVAEGDGEAEFARVELNCDTDVSDEELGFGGETRGHGGVAVRVTIRRHIQLFAGSMRVKDRCGGLTAQN